MSHARARQRDGASQYMNEKLNRHNCPRSAAGIHAVQRLICVPSKLNSGESDGVSSQADLRTRAICIQFILTGGRGEMRMMTTKRMVRLAKVINICNFSHVTRQESVFRLPYFLKPVSARSVVT